MAWVVGAHVFGTVWVMMTMYSQPLLSSTITHHAYLRFLFLYPSTLKQNGDFPFKFGTYMGCDAWGNRYYENRVDYPLGQHRWIEPKDIHNFDSTQIPPEWHGWMTHMNDCTPAYEDEYISMQLSRLRVGEISHAPYQTNIGMQMPLFHFHGMHNQSQIRSRGYGIGNHVVGLPPTVGTNGDAYYTQPGSPYNPASRVKQVNTALWKERLEGPADKKKEEEEWNKAFASKKNVRLSLREQAMQERGGTTVATASR